MMSISPSAAELFRLWPALRCPPLSSCRIMILIWFRCAPSGRERLGVSALFAFLATAFVKHVHALHVSQVKSSQVR